MKFLQEKSQKWLKELKAALEEQIIPQDNQEKKAQEILKSRDKDVESDLDKDLDKASSRVYLDKASSRVFSEILQLEASSRVFSEILQLESLVEKVEKNIEIMTEKNNYCKSLELYCTTDNTILFFVWTD